MFLHVQHIGFRLNCGPPEKGTLHSASAICGTSRRRGPGAQSWPRRGERGQGGMGQWARARTSEQPAPQPGRPGRAASGPGLACQRAQPASRPAHQGRARAGQGWARRPARREPGVGRWAGQQASQQPAGHRAGAGLHGPGLGLAERAGAGAGQDQRQGQRASQRPGLGQLGCPLGPGAPAQHCAPNRATCSRGRPHVG